MATTHENTADKAVPLQPVDPRAVISCLVTDYLIRLVLMVPWTAQFLWEGRPFWVFAVALILFAGAISPQSSNWVRRRFGFPRRSWMDDEPFQELAYVSLGRAQWRRFHLGLGLAMTLYAALIGSLLVGGLGGTALALFMCGVTMFILSPPTRRAVRLREELEQAT